VPTGAGRPASRPAQAGPPPAPTGLTATAVDPHTIQLAWTDHSGGAAQYEVFNGNTSAYTGAGATRYGWGGLSAGAYMCFAIRAFDNAGTSAWVPATSPYYVCATTPIPLPTGLTATVADPHTIQLAWTDNSGGAAQYQIINGSTSVDTAAGATGYNWSGISAGTFMCFSIMAFTASAYAPSWVGWACATTPIPLPTAVTVFPIDSASIHVTWTDNSGGAAQYQVYNGNTSANTAAGATSYDWGGLTAGTYMCFSILAFTADTSASSWVPSGWACTTTPAVGKSAQPAPGWLQLFAPDSSTFHLYWPDRAGSNAQYELSNGSASQILGAGAISYDWGGLAPGTYMCFQIRAFSADGASAWVPAPPIQVCGTTPSASPVPPPGPGNVTASAPSSYMTHVTWTDNSGGAAQFQIDNGSATMITNAGATSFDWGGELPGTNTCFRIRAVSTAGASPWAPGS
jgi:hypothetical protein